MSAPGRTLRELFQAPWSGRGGFERRLRQRMNSEGWTTRSSALCSFTAQKADLDIYVLAGRFLLDHRFSPTRATFTVDVRGLIAKGTLKAPLVVAVTEDEAGAAYYEGIAGSEAHILSWQTLFYIEALAAPDKPASDEARRWAASVIRSNTMLCVRQSRVELRQGRITEARQMAERAVELDQRSAGAICNFADVALAAGDVDAAGATLHKALSTLGRRSDFLRRQSEVLLQRGDGQAALIAIQEAVALNAQDAHAQHQLARACMKLGDARAAEDAARRAVELDPKNPAFARRLREIGEAR